MGYWALWGGLCNQPCSILREQLGRFQAIHETDEDLRTLAAVGRWNLKWEFAYSVPNLDANIP